MTYVWAFDELLQNGDKVKISYFENEIGQLEIVQMEYAEVGNTISNAAGVFTGFIDNHSVEIRFNDAFKAFNVPE